MYKKSFDEYGLSEEIIETLQGLAYKTPTSVQEKVIAPALAGEDLLVVAQTGSGKTASFGVPLCEKIIWLENKPQALILVPTRELAVQVREEIANIGRFKRIKAIAIYGKSPFERQKEALKQKNHIVVGTPGRVLDHLQKGTLSTEKLKYIVLDEADKMLNMGFITQIEEITDFLQAERQSLLFSATMPEEIEKIAKLYLKDDAKRIVIENDEEHMPLIESSSILVLDKKKENVLIDVCIVENPDSCIIFANTQETVNFLEEKLKGHGFPVGKLHGGMFQKDRFEVMENFRDGKFRYLVATDVAARGIDIEKISHIINYDVPVEKESFTHRIGRTARAGKEGKSITLLTERELNRFDEIKENYNGNIVSMEIPDKDEVKNSRKAFEIKIKKAVKSKKKKSHTIDKDIMKLYFNGGKRKKLRAVDFVGTISKLEGVNSEDIGIISICDLFTFVEILNGKGDLVLEEMKSRSIKGKQLKVHKAKS